VSKPALKLVIYPHVSNLVCEQILHYESSHECTNYYNMATGIVMEGRDCWNSSRRISCCYEGLML